VLRRDATTLEDVLHAAVELARPLLDEGGHEFSVRLPEQSVALSADRERLSQVFSNLLNNAAKYSDAGSRIELDAALTDDGQVIVSVIDTGIGLAPEQLDAVFGLFNQVDSTIERARGGLGIGLTLVQKLAEMHAGRVEVRSAGLGQGSVFSVHLPIGDSPVSQLLLAPEGSAAVASATPVADPIARVLVVDDNRDAADTLAMMISLLGHEVTQIYDPYAVEAEIERFAPTLIFLDVGMPGRSGYDIATSLRQGPNGQALEIVAVTGWGQLEDQRRTRDAGFDAHLVKPPQFESIQRICSHGARSGADQA
jgi:CheY-like chemotaxis protein